MSVRVLVVDDHPLFRDGVRTALSGEDDLEVVGEADDVASALQRVAEDAARPGPDGPEPAGRLRHRGDPRRARRAPDRTDPGDDDVAGRRRRGGRDAGRCSRLRRQGCRPARPGPVRADRRSRRRGLQPGRSPTGSAGYFTGLAAVPGREAFPAAHRARAGGPGPAGPRPGQPAASPASSFLSDKTVRNHVSHLLAKLEVETRSEAVLRARNAGLGGSAR